MVLSPDGCWLAYVLKRPRATSSFHKYDFLNGGDRGDVWLVEAAGGAPWNLTRGEADGCGYWAPSWSPDGKRLAMLSTRGGNVHLWGCEIASGMIERLCERPVDLDWTAAPSIWVSERTLLLATLAEGERPLRMAAEVQAAEAAMREWPKAWKGEEPTGSALDSGLAPPFSERPQGELQLLDVVSGRARSLMRGFFRELRLAPDGRHVSFLRQVDVIRPAQGRKLEPARERVRLGIVALDTLVVAEAVEEIEAPGGGSLRWSPDSTQLALIGRRDGRPRLLRYRFADGRLEQATDTGLEPTAIAWAAGRQILAYARSPSAGDAAVERAEWWLVGGEHEESRGLASCPGTAPTELLPDEDGESFVGLGGGDIWRLSPGDGRWVNLTAGSAPKIAWIAWPGSSAPDRGPVRRLVLAVNEETATAWYSLDLLSGELTSLAWPTDRGWLLDFDPEHSIAVTVAVDRNGTRLWISRPAFESHRAVLEANAWLGDVAEGEIRRIEYQGLDGSALNAWLIAPIDDDRRAPAPLIVSGYPGHVWAAGSPPPRMLSIAAHHALDLQLLAAHGYAVLLPSIPLKPEGEPSDPYLELTNGVLPAIDKAIELGLADPHRLGVMGQSYGGYGVYGLITQTRRFQAAIALAGFADLVGLYGQFDPRDRYTEHPHEHMLQTWLAEAGQIRMGAPPWDDAERYVRNSPIFHADQVETPLLIIQGDMDYVPLQQGEQFFSALYRQGKRARFVRYWGEGHVFQSPANIRNMWQEIHAWFDNFLRRSQHPMP